MNQASEQFEGTVSFINDLKNYGLIKYKEGEKPQQIIFFLTSARQFQLQQQGTQPAGHHFWAGDVVWFKRKMSDKIEGNYIAYEVAFKNNPAMTELLERAKDKNHFFGQFVKADDRYFVKEYLSEIVFPLQFIEYEMPPAGDLLAKHAYFRITNVHDSKSRAAELIEKNFVGINEDVNYHLLHGTVFDADVLLIWEKYIEFWIPFFSRDARLDTNNCNAKQKIQYSRFQQGERLRIKLWRKNNDTLYVKIADHAL